jgi:hypothetical protein
MEELVKACRLYASFIVATEVRLKEFITPGSPLFEILVYRSIENLSVKEAEGLIRETLNEVGYAFPKEDIALILELSGRFPFLLIHAAAQVWEIRRRHGLLVEREPQSSSEQEGGTLLEEKVSLLDMLAEGLSEFYRPFFKSYWDALNEKEQAAAQKLAGLPGSAIAREQVKSLLDKGLILPVLDKDAGYRLFSSLFAAYVHAQEPVKDPLPPAPGLSETENKLFDYLRASLNEVCEIAGIYQAVWGAEQKDDEYKTHRVQVLAARLRTKLKKRDEYDIRNEAGVGYKLIIK